MTLILAHSILRAPKGRIAGIKTNVEESCYLQTLMMQHVAFPLVVVNVVMYVQLNVLVMTVHVLINKRPNRKIGHSYYTLYNA